MGRKKEDVSEEEVEEAGESAGVPVEKSEDEELSIEDIPGVGAATAEKLRESGYDDLISVAVATPGELVNLAGVTEVIARKMINFSREKLNMGFESGEDALKRRESVEKIGTGSEALNALLGGGVETGAITEMFGAYGSGKSQLGFALLVNCQLKDPDAVGVIVDTESTFRPERIKELANGSGLDPEKVLKNIRVARAYNSDHQMLLTEKVDDLIKQGLKVKVLVIDSLTAHFRAEFIGRGTLADRQQKINKHIHTLLKLAQKHNICVYVTNQVMARPDVFFGDPTEAIGGHIVAHGTTFRVYLRRGKKGTRVAKLVDSPHLPEAECGFYIDTAGIRDVK